MRLSPSGLKLFDDCPGAFAAKYVHGIKEDDNEPAIVGSDDHALIEAKLKNLPLPFDHKPSQEAYDIYQIFEKTFLPDIDPQNVLSLEELVELQLDDQNSLAVKMDLLLEIGGFLTGVDYKTTRAMLTVEAMRKNIQIRAYCIAMLKLYPHHDEGIFQIWNIRLNQRQYLEFTREETEVWEESLKALMSLVAARMEAYKGGQKDALPFMPGAPCLTCGYFKACKPAQTALKPPKSVPGTLYLPPKNAKGAVALASRLDLIEKHWEEAKKALKIYCEAKGSVKTNGKIWGLHVTEGLKVDTDVLPTADSGPGGQELWNRLEPYRKVDATKKSKIWENTGLLEKLKIHGALKPTSSVSFAGKNVKEEESQ